MVGVLGQDSVAVAELAVEDGNISHGLAQILSLDMEEEIASVSDLYHLLATHIAVQVRLPTTKRIKAFRVYIKQPLLSTS